MYQLNTYNKGKLIDREIIVADKPGLDETKKLGSTVQELSYIGPDKGNEGLLVKIPDGRYGRTYDQLGHIYGKVPVFPEKKPESFEFEATAILFDAGSISIRGSVS